MQGDRIAMLLDLDQGSMTVWKNDEQLGLMTVEGLRGPFCWAVSVYAIARAPFTAGSSVRSPRRRPRHRPRRSWRPHGPGSLRRSLTTNDHGSIACLWTFSHSPPH